MLRKLIKTIFERCSKKDKFLYKPSATEINASSVCGITAFLKTLFTSCHLFYITEDLKSLKRNIFSLFLNSYKNITPVGL